MYPCIQVWTPSSTLQVHRWRITNSQPSLSSSKGNHLLSPGRCDIRAKHPFLWKTWGWFTCRSLRKSCTTHYAFKPRIIVPKHSSRDLEDISFVPIKGNQILLFAKYFGKTTFAPYLHLSIHEIRSDIRVGPTLWSFNGSVDGRFNILHLGLIKSTENALGITFGVRFDDHWKLFSISTTDTDASDNFPLIASGKIDFDIKLKLEWMRENCPGLSEIHMQSCWTWSNVFSKSHFPLTDASS